ncbi:MAG: hypothetical protein ACQESN_11235 [Thermotogota bacterium]
MRVKLTELFNCEVKDLMFNELFLIINLMVTAEKSISLLKAKNVFAYYESNKDGKIHELKEQQSVGMEQHPMLKSGFEANLNIIETFEHEDLPTRYLGLVICMANLESPELRNEFDGLEKLKNYLSFYAIRHTTSKKIIKSVAIVLYQYFNNYHSTKKHLKEHIGELIDLFFETKKPYSNFKDFEKKYFFLESHILDFPIFGCDYNKHLKHEKFLQKKLAIIINESNPLEQKFKDLLNDEKIIKAVSLDTVKIYLDISYFKNFGNFPKNNYSFTSQK